MASLVRARLPMCTNARLCRAPPRHGRPGLTRCCSPRIRMRIHQLLLGYERAEQQLTRGQRPHHHVARFTPAGCLMLWRPRGHAPAVRRLVARWVYLAPRCALAIVDRPRATPRDEPRCSELTARGQTRESELKCLRECAHADPLCRCSYASATSHAHPNFASLRHPHPG